MLQNFNNLVQKPKFLMRPEEVLVNRPGDAVVVKVKILEPVTFFPNLGADKVNSVLVKPTEVNFNTELVLAGDKYVGTVHVSAGTTQVSGKTSKLVEPGKEFEMKVFISRDDLLSYVEKGWIEVVSVNKK